MRYWSVFVLYVSFVSFMSYAMAQMCEGDKSRSVMTGAACSIKELREMNDAKKLAPIEKPKIKVIKKAVSKPTK